MASITGNTPSTVEQQARISSLEALFPKVEEAVAVFIDINSKKWSKKQPHL